jgi:hypothetical protein
MRRAFVRIGCAIRLLKVVESRLAGRREGGVVEEKEGGKRARRN